MRQELAVGGSTVEPRLARQEGRVVLFEDDPSPSLSGYPAGWRAFRYKAASNWGVLNGEDTLKNHHEACDA